MKNEGVEKTIKILYDSRTLNEGLYPDWGLSIYIENGEEKILFDVGQDKNILTQNMEQLGIDKKDINLIVISHRHWDHFGGLSAFEDQDIKIYVIDSLVDRIDKKFDLVGEIIPVKDRTEITEGVYSTGELGRAVKEQSLLVEGDDGIYVLTGCGHPGVGKIIKEASKVGKVKGLIGGYHGFDDLKLIAELYRSKNIPLLVPCHCTVLAKKIEDRYPESYRKCGAGFTVKI
ncbi:MAG: MBL fold metallo-hydrolase [Candidatus Saliniplasma sp.]